MGCFMFEVGDYVVKSNTGICKVEDIVFLDMHGGGEKQYYVLLPIDDARSKLFVNVEADRTKVRAVMTKDDAVAFIHKMGEIRAVWISNDKLREQKYKEAFRSNEPEAILGVIKNLHLRGQARIAEGKKIAATDEKYFRMAEQALYSELSFALELDKEGVQALIRETKEGRR